MAETGTRQCIQGSVYFLQNVFQTQHNGNQGSGIPHAEREAATDLRTTFRFMPTQVVSEHSDKIPIIQVK